MSTLSMGAPQTRVCGGGSHLWTALSTFSTPFASGAGICPAQSNKRGGGERYWVSGGGGGAGSACATRSAGPAPRHPRAQSQGPGRGMVAGQVDG